MLAGIRRVAVSGPVIILTHPRLPRIPRGGRPWVEEPTGRSGAASVRCARTDGREGHQ
jgi:hypothetical protein